VFVDRSLARLHIVDLLNSRSRLVRGSSVDERHRHAGDWYWSVHTIGMAEMHLAAIKRSRQFVE